MGPGRELAKRREMAEKCRSCGTCRSVCPIFAEVGQEVSGARGRVALMRAVLDGELELTKLFDQRVQLCLNCKACIDACPNDVRVDDLTLAARSGLVEAGRLPLVKRLVFRQLLRRGRLLPPVGRTAAFFQRFVLRGLPKDSPFRLLLPVVGIDRDRIFPQFAPRSFLTSVADVVPARAVGGSPGDPPASGDDTDVRPASTRDPEPSSDERSDGDARLRAAVEARRVAFFAGCAANLIYPESARAAVDALAGSGVEVVVPKSQGCCGTPVFNSGDFVTARAMAKRNIDVLRASGADAVVTACASCGLTLKREYEELLGFEGGVGLPVFDFTEFLALRRRALQNGTGSAAPQGESTPEGANRPRIRVTFHDPCHLVRGQGIKDEPRDVLRALPWVEFVEMRDADRCCGCGGSFSLTHYDLAKAIGRRKVEAIRDADVDVVATECQACVMQLSDMLAQAGLDVPVVSVAELVAQGPPDRAGRREGAESPSGSAGRAQSLADSV